MSVSPIIDSTQAHFLCAEPEGPISVPSLEVLAKTVGADWDELKRVGKSYAWIEGYLTAKLATP